jgi:hypothetical protein
MRGELDVLHVHDLTRLNDRRGSSWISMFLPISHRRSQPPSRPAEQSAATRAGRTARRRHLRRAGRHPRRAGPPTLGLRSLWNQPDHGLALFLGPDEFRHFRLPVGLPELVTIGDRFLTRPLLPPLTAAGHFYVMSLHQKGDSAAPRHPVRTRRDDARRAALAVWLTMPRRCPRLHAQLSDLGVADRVGLDGADNDGESLVLQHFQRVD